MGPRTQVSPRVSVNFLDLVFLDGLANTPQASIKGNFILVTQRTAR